MSLTYYLQQVQTALQEIPAHVVARLSEEEQDRLQGWTLNYLIRYGANPPLHEVLVVTQKILYGGG